MAVPACYSPGLQFSEVGVLYHINCMDLHLCVARYGHCLIYCLIVLVKWNKDKADGLHCVQSYPKEQLSFKVRLNYGTFLRLPLWQADAQLTDLLSASNPVPTLKTGL